MKKYRIVDNVVGWVIFLIAAFVYCSTVEPTASFWDCPEFITTGYKMEIGHPPGAPFFMLTANLFSQFTSDPSQVALMVNIMNAILSAVCILFLFWTITHLTRKLIMKDWSELDTAKLIAIEAAGAVGALIYAFSDTFWFSAVEGEVYAYSSAFTAVVFWLILKWEDDADNPHSDRWLVLIAYMTGLSIGVHLLNLLCIPAIVLVYYYRRFPQANGVGSIIALIISAAIVAAVLYGVVPGIITVGGWFELLFVNVLHCPFNTGLYIYMVILVAVVIWAIYESYHDKSPMRQNISFLAAVAMLGVPFYGYGWQAALTGIVALIILAVILNYKQKGQPIVTARLKNTITLCMLMLMIGYSSYAVIVIRSAANPPMDQNSPEDIFTLGNYLSRDQYGYRPLFYGQAYNSEYKADERGYVKMNKTSPIYQRREKASADEPDTYFIVDWKQQPEYEQNMFFPRMYSSAHRDLYESIIDVKGKLVPSSYGEGAVKMPTQMDNLRFFISYQCNFMYWRYFMWNFAGRQNDIQGNGEREFGNWISGIPFIDNLRLGDQELLPDELKANKGHNVFYCLPLLLGLIGLLWQAFRGERGIKQFWVVFFLFFMTGLAIVVYLNQTPNQPRERDYAYAGSFYAFAIWCGLGVAAIYDWLKKLKLSPIAASAIAAIACLLVPIQMVSQTWDDHDRSGRYTCRDFGQNYLMSLQDDGYPIIFTNGDNDTFPLWYNQEVEGVRTDARVCNLSYLQTPWYIDQMRRPAYESPAVPITWNRYEYVAGTNEGVPVRPEMMAMIDEYYKTNPEQAKQELGENPYELKNILKYWVRSTNEQMKVIPTDSIVVPIDKEAVKRSGMTIPDSVEIPDYMVISLEGRNALYKNSLMLLEMLAECNWERPLYFAMTVGPSNFLNLESHFVQEGLTYRITPFDAYNSGMGVDVDKMYDNMMNKFKFGEINKPGVYLDETVARMCLTHRRTYSLLAFQLMARGDSVRALKVAEFIDKNIPESTLTYADNLGGSTDLASIFMSCGKKEKAMAIYNTVYRSAKQYLDWYMEYSPNDIQSNKRECARNLSSMFSVVSNLRDAGVKEAESLLEETSSYYARLQSKGINVAF